MKFKELVEMTQEELDNKHRNLKEELFNLIFQSSLSKSPKPHKVKWIKKDIARIETLLLQKERS